VVDHRSGDRGRAVCRRFKLSVLLIEEENVGLGGGFKCVCYDSHVETRANLLNCRLVKGEKTGVSECTVCSLTETAPGGVHDEARTGITGNALER